MSAIINFIISNLLIVWFLAPHVSDAVHKKRNVQRNAKPSVEVNPKRIPQCFMPEVNRNAYWQKDSEYKKPQRVESENKIGIIINVVRIRQSIVIIEAIRIWHNI